MKRVLIICAHRPNRSPSQRYRFEQYLPFLQSQGYEFTWSYLIKEKEDRKFYADGHYLLKVKVLLRAYWIRYKDILRADSFDIVFEQRESLFTGSVFFETAIRKKNKFFILDFDDSIWMADTSPANKKFEWLKQPKKIFDVFNLATTIIAGNAYLAKRAKEFNANVVIIPTTIDTDKHRPLPKLNKTGKITIGWSGSVSTIKHFLLLKPVIGRLKMRYGDALEFIILADKTYTDPEIDLVSKIWTPENEVSVLNSFDIGVMPLPDDAWSQGKCGLKGLSYMACGVATVMSPVGVNKTIIDQGKNGILAEDEIDWFNAISQLIDQPELRQNIAAAGRQTVIDKFSVEANKHNYLAVFGHA